MTDMGKKQNKTKTWHPPW